MSRIGIAVIIFLSIVNIWLVITMPSSVVSKEGHYLQAFTKLEQFLKDNNASAKVAEAYRFALQNPQGVLSQVKCYCGCIKTQGHRNDRDCFINEDGTFDLMGLNCGLCVKTALVAKQMLAEGKSVQEISDYVDARWGKN